MTKHTLPFSHVAFSLLIGTVSIPAMATPAQNPITIQVSYGGSVYNLTSQITSYNADSALLQSQPWWGNYTLANNLAGQVLFQLGNNLSYIGTSDPGALLAYETYGAGCCVESATSPFGFSPWGELTTDQRNFVILGQPQITLNDLSASLASTSQGVDTALVSAELMLNGAHSRPLSRRVAAGQKTGWIAGDWGRDDHGSRDGTTGLAELGGGYNFGAAQLNVSAGQTWARQDLVQNGKVDFDGQYVVAEVIMPIASKPSLFATVGAYGHWGEADTRRGYLVAGTQDYSYAKPDTHTVGMRARLDWENAFTAAGAQFTPYADLNYAESRMDAYTETGGAFPAQFAARKDHTTDLRLGFNAAKPIASTRFNFIGNLEAAHRFDDRGAAATGSVNGLFTFNLDGEKYDRTWLKAGAGVEGMIGKGKASMMLNATTKGEMPNAWLAASYQLTF